MRRSLVLPPRGLPSSAIRKLQRDVRRMGATRGRGTRKKQGIMTSGNSAIITGDLEGGEASASHPPVWG